MLNAIIIPSGKFIFPGYAEYLARITVQRNKSPIKKRLKSIQIHLDKISKD